jgi:hypothetical protein
MLQSHAKNTNIGEKFMPAIAECHKRTRKWMSINSTTNFYEAFCFKKIDRVGPYNVCPPTFAATLLQCCCEVFIKCTHTKCFKGFEEIVSIASSVVMAFCLVQK